MVERDERPGQHGLACGWRFQLLRAEDVSTGDSKQEESGEFLDAYCRVMWNGREVGRTKTVMHEQGWTRSPVWQGKEHGAFFEDKLKYVAEAAAKRKGLRALLRKAQFGTMQVSSISLCALVFSFRVAFRCFFSLSSPSRLLC